MRMNKFFPIAALALLAACSSGPSPEMQANMDKMAANKKAYEALMNCWSTGDKAMADSLLADNFMTHNPDPMIKSTGKQAWLEAMDMYRGMNPDMKGEGKVIIADGDWVGAVAMVAGTNTGSAPGMPATNKGWNVTGMDFIRFENGKAVEHWGLFDNMTMMTQLGLMPAMGAEPDTAAAAVTATAD
ncbi:MAG: ester cyclase [Flavobacteriales bacterium]